MGIGYGLTALATGLANGASSMMEGKRAGEQMLLQRYIAQLGAQREAQQTSDQHDAATAGLLAHGVVRGAPRPDGVQALPGAQGADGNAPAWGDALGAAGATMPKASGDVDLGNGLTYRGDLDPARIKGQNSVLIQGMKNDGTANVATIKDDGATTRNAATNTTKVQTTDQTNRTKVQTAGIGADARVQSAGIGANARVQSAGIGAGARVQAAGITAGQSGAPSAAGTSAPLGGIKAARLRIQLASAFAHDDEIKRASEMGRAAQTAISGIQQARGGNPMGGVAAVEGVGSVLHTGIVRKNDKGLIIDAQGFPDQVQAGINRAIGNGGIFDQHTLDQMEQIVRTQVQNQAPLAAAAVQRHAAVARASGIDPTPYLHNPLTDAAPQGAASAPAPAMASGPLSAAMAARGGSGAGGTAALQQAYDRAAQHLQAQNKGAAEIAQTLGPRP